MDLSPSLSHSPVRFGYVGCGFIAQNVHIPNFASLPECRFLALAEVREDLGKAVAARYGIPKVYRSHEEIAADPEIEAVAVSGPFAMQGRIAEELLRAGKQVFMEKPMAVSVARAEAIVKAEQANGGRLMVAYMKRYDAGNVLLKKHLDAWRQSDEAGELLYARNHGFCGNWTYAADPNVTFVNSDEPAPPASSDCPRWIPQEREWSYRSYLQQWTHNINLLRFFLGDTGGKTQVKAVDFDDDGMTGIVVLEVNGTRSVVESAQTDFHGWEEHTQIYFKKGWLRTAAPALLKKETPATVELYRAHTEHAPARHVVEEAPPSWAFREEAKHFLECVRSGAPFHSSAADTLHDVRLCEEIYRKFLKL